MRRGGLPLCGYDPNSSVVAGVPLPETGHTFIAANYGR